MGQALPGVFETVRLRLRPVAAQDATATFEAYARDSPRHPVPDVAASLCSGGHQGLRFLVPAIAPDLARTYVLVHRASGALLGALDVRFTAWHRVEFGYVLGRTWWGRGLMTEALVAVVDRALKQPAIFRIGSVCDVENKASARVMEKAGLVLEGVRRRWLVHPNRGTGLGIV